MIIYEYQHLAHKMYFSIWWNTRELVLKTDTFSDSNIIRVVKKNSLKKSYKRCWSQTFLILEFLELLILWVFFLNFFITRLDYMRNIKESGLFTAEMLLKETTIFEDTREYVFTSRSHFQEVPPSWRTWGKLLLTDKRLSIIGKSS